MRETFSLPHPLYTSVWSKTVAVLIDPALYCVCVAYLVYRDRNTNTVLLGHNLSVIPALFNFNHFPEHLSSALFLNSGGFLHSGTWLALALVYFSSIFPFCQHTSALHIYLFQHHLHASQQRASALLSS